MQYTVNTLREDSMSIRHSVCGIAIAIMGAAAAVAQEAPRTWSVSPGQSIQEAIDKAAEGDTVQVLPGEYVQSVAITKNGITLRGLEYEGERTTLKAKVNEEDEPLEVGVLIGGNDIVVEGLMLSGFGKSGVAADNASGIVLRDLIIEDIGFAGVQFDDIREGTIERVVAGRIGGVAIAIEDSSACRIAQSEGFAARFGLYLGNSQQVQIDNSTFHHNGIGMVLSGSTDDPEKRLAYVKVLRTRVMGNNAAIAGTPGLYFTGAPSGIGILIVGATEAEFAQAQISGNGSMGVITLSYDDKGVQHLAKDAPRSGPPAEHIYMHDNFYADNGGAPSVAFSKHFAGIPGGDLYWDGLGERNQWQENTELKTHPEKLVVEQGGVHTDVIHFQ